MLQSLPVKCDLLTLGGTHFLGDEELLSLFSLSLEGELQLLVGFPCNSESSLDGCFNLFYN